jgi:hypothetical protein
VLKQYEDASLLDYESRMLDYLNTHKGQLNLTSTYPRPCFIQGNRTIKVRLDEPSMAMLEGQIKKDGTFFSLDTSDGYHTLMAYQTEGNGYFTYLRDSAIEPEQFKQALLVNMHDLFTLARYGIIHTALIELFHNLSTDREDRGKYLWMVDIFRDIEERSGAGRLHAWTSAVEYPNMRLSGLADFPDFYPLKELAKESNRVSEHMNTLLEHHPGYDSEVFYLASYLGDYLLSATLITGRYFRDRDELDWRNPSKLASLMQDCYVAAFAAFTERPEEEVQLLSDAIDWNKFAMQMALNMAKGNELAEFLLNKNIPDEIYGPDAKINYSEDYSNARGWHDTPKIKGWYDDGRNPDLGPVNGPNPLQELIKANYIFTALSIAELIKGLAESQKQENQNLTLPYPAQSIPSAVKQPAAAQQKITLTIKQAA